ncbi:baculoviral IAP repeat-containing protein 2-like [Patella vulgata]|uniref:baculoviral IAP repeat-containing protein 2-like n=1 Tax=Patella vulgata TaxID=6465 RepID=UPI0024A96A7E|nr:baculoviral IAP repeat-containing protein 2-like [Patella vulgata]XP_055959408.1 baculoviral IAP repeat-containing protein 2-like [Patella vulgata]XP_055959409.1 baculoviral IAP repeat-containing protein 2-like [Patella vulgata]
MSQKTSTAIYQSITVDELESWSREHGVYEDFSSTSDCMKYEWMRLGSFKSFPRQSEGRPIKLAKAGFVFTSTREGDDTVTCFTCGVTKNNWLKYEDPLQVHKDLNPRCHFMNNESENVDILVPGVIVYDKILKTLHDTYCCGSRNKGPVVCDDSSPRDDSEPVDASSGSDLSSSVWTTDQIPEHGCRLTDAVYISWSQSLTNKVVTTSSASVVLTADSTRQTMTAEEARLRTFGNWPRYLAVRPAELARAGFYYLGSADRVQCAFCRGILRDWEEAESPVAEHWRHFSSCEFLRGTDQSNVPIIPNDSYIHDYVSTTNDDALTLIIGGPRR